MRTRDPRFTIIPFCHGLLGCHSQHFSLHYECDHVAAFLIDHRDGVALFRGQVEPIGHPRWPATPALTDFARRGLRDAPGCS